MSLKLRSSTPEKEGVYQGSKWLKIQLLCDGDELKSLFDALNPFSIFPLTGIVAGVPTEKETFINVYQGWIEKLKKGEIPKDAELREILAAAFIRDEDSLWLQEIPGRGFLTKVAKPVLQVQAHYFTYSKLDGVFRPMSMGSDSIFWGLQFSFPQIYQDGATYELKEAEEDELFITLRKWVRDATRATPFVVEGNRVNSPIRLGKNCFSWIANHKQLKEQNIGIFQ